MKPTTGAEIRQSFIDYFIEKGHTFVPSSSLVPGGDSTLLFTNAGMVQFKDVFLGTDNRPYNRAANSQKCMRVAGKHNDLDDVGRDDSHHTFFEMLGNWSFGDYYKKEAIEWAWDLLTVRWGIDPQKLWTTYFQDDKGDVPTDEEARDAWRKQPGMIAEHVITGGRKDNFWEMAATGPCGPCSEIHIDRGPQGCNKQGEPGHVCKVNGDCTRFLELWNLVFIQYNRISADQLDPLPAKHVDTGMGLDRVVSIMQGVNSNYRTDLLFPLVQQVQQLTGYSDAQMEAEFTPFRVIADHTRACVFLISDGVIPGNVGRNYICRMIIRRASRFGGKLGLHEPFMAKVADTMIKFYGPAYPDLVKNRQTILDTLTREEKRFHRTLESGLEQLSEFTDSMAKKGEKVLDGNSAFELYATHGLPLELTRDVLLENGLDVDTEGFKKSMEEHRIASGSKKFAGGNDVDDVDTYRELLEDLIDQKKLGAEGVGYNPYDSLSVTGQVLAILKNGLLVDHLDEGEEGEVLLPATCFYVEAGGQVSDQGVINGKDGEFNVTRMRKPAAGVIVHGGTQQKGTLRVGETVIAHVDEMRRQDIRRNHTATHLLHAWLHKILGGHAVQAGSLVAPEKLRFDFNHPDAVTPQQLDEIESGVNEYILRNYDLNTKVKSLQEALDDGATALFGEKYGQEVRTITIGGEKRLSYELCGGTHVNETGDIGLFLITSEGSAAAGVRRIEAVTGREAYMLVKHRTQLLRQSAATSQTSVDELPGRVESLVKELDTTRKSLSALKQKQALTDFSEKLSQTEMIGGSAVLALLVPEVDVDTLRILSDRFREKFASGVVLLASVNDQKPMILCSVSDDLVKRGVNAGDIVKAAALGGGRQRWWPSQYGAGGWQGREQG